MKTHRTILIAVILSSQCGLAAAQTFNTIDNSRPRYKVEHTVTSIHEKETPSADSNFINEEEPTAIAVDSTSHVSSLSTLTVHPPLASPLRITSPYGIRRHPTLRVNKMHNGVDLHAKREPVYAMLPGTVVKTGYDNVSGNYITLQHASLRVSYCHLSHIGCKTSDYVYAGQPLGIAGNTGRSTGVHLHLTIKLDGRNINPAIVLKYLGQNL